VQGKKIQFRTKKKANKQKLERKRLIHVFIQFTEGLVIFG